MLMILCLIFVMKLLRIVFVFFQIDETAHRLQTYYAVPKVLAHYKSRKKMSVLAKKHYAPPKNHAGMKLLANIGCSGIARKNICWHPPTGLNL